MLNGSCLMNSGPIFSCRKQNRIFSNMCILWFFMKYSSFTFAFVTYHDKVLALINLQCQVGWAIMNKGYLLLSSSSIAIMVSSVNPSFVLDSLIKSKWWISEFGLKSYNSSVFKISNVLITFRYVSKKYLYFDSFGSFKFIRSLIHYQIS